jgi:hypothetical protein
MNKIVTLFSSVGVFSALSLSAVPSVDFFSIQNNAAVTNSATVTLTNSYTDAWVVLGWTEDSGGSNSTTAGATFNSVELTGIRTDVLGSGTYAVYDGVQGSQELWYANLGALAAGDYVWDTGSTNGKPGVALWIVDGVDGIRDTASASYRDEDNGSNGPIAIGFNLSGTVNTPGTVNTATDVSDTVFDVVNGDAVIGFFSSGASVDGQIGGNQTVVGTVALDETLNVFNNGGGYWATSTNSATSNMVGVDEIDSSWFRTAGSAISFIPTPVPEPSAYALLAGMLTLGFVASRRRRA